MTRRTSDILDAAAERIGKPEAWTQHVLALDVDGVAVDPTSPHAVCWCIEGALAREALGPRELLDAESAVERLIDGRGIARWNDDVCDSADSAVDLLRRAARAEREAGR